MYGVRLIKSNNRSQQVSEYRCLLRYWFIPCHLYSSCCVWYSCVLTQPAGILIKSISSFKNSWFYFSLSTDIPYWLLSYSYVIDRVKNTQAFRDADLQIVYARFSQIHEIFSNNSGGNTLRT